MPWVLAASLLRRCLLAAGLCVAPGLAAAWVLSDLGTLGGAETIVQSFAGPGQLVGYGSNGQGLTRAFLYRDGTISDLGTLYGGVSSLAFAGNAAGQVTGNSYVPGNGVRAFLYAGSTMAELGVSIFDSYGTHINASGGVAGWQYDGQRALAFVYNDTVGATLISLQPGGSSHVTGFNDAGQATGHASVAGGNLHAFFYDSGSTRDLGTLGGDVSVATALNAAGQAVGYAQTFQGAIHAFLATSGQLLDLGTLGGVNSSAFDINDAGRVVGYAYTAVGERHAFSWLAGVMTDLGTLGGNDSVAQSVSATGLIVGTSSTAAGVGDWFVHADGSGMLALNDLLSGTFAGADVQSAFVSDGGEIAGVARLPGGADRSFLLTPSAPVPEPVTAQLMAAGLCVGLCLWRTRRCLGTGTGNTH